MLWPQVRGISVQSLLCSPTVYTVVSIWGCNQCMYRSKVPEMLHTELECLESLRVEWLTLIRFAFQVRWKGFTGKHAVNLYECGLPKVCFFIRSEMDPQLNTCLLVLLVNAHILSLESRCNTVYWEMNMLVHSITVLLYYWLVSCRSVM